MNRNQILFIVMPFFLIFGYQNCQRPPAGESGYTDFIDPRFSGDTLKVQVIDLSNEVLDALQVKSREVSQVIHAGKSISVIKDIIYDFDIKTGELFVVDEQAGTSQRYCLTQALKDELIQLLQVSSVCKHGVRSNEGQVCAQVMVPGFANLMTTRDQFRLGSSTDSCGSNLIELCGGDDILKTWFSNFKPRLPELSCQ